MDSPTLMIAAVVGVVVLGVIWFAVRFWLASTRPADIKDVHTPMIDKLNQQALEGFGGDSEAEDDDDEEEDSAADEAPEGLKGIVPEEQEK